MKFAIWSPTNPRAGVSHVDLYRQQVREIEIAEELGFDHIWLYEHHVSPSGPMPSPNLMIAAAAYSTSRIRLGTMVNILPYRNPLLVAEEAAMLDVLTNGRLDMGIGRGLKPVEFDAFCVPQSQSREMFLESLSIIKRVWADENFAFAGKYFKVDKKTPLSPPLVQKPHPPLLISAQSEESLRFAAENDLPFAQIDALIEECERDQTYYRDIQVASGHAPSDRLFITREIFVADTDEQARREAYPHLVAYWDIWNRYTQFTKDGRMPDDYDVWRKRAPMLHAMKFDEVTERGLVMIGSPETVARQIIEHQRRLDLFAFAGVFKFGGMPFDMLIKSMRAFSAHVMPLVKQAEAAKPMRDRAVKTSAPSGAVSAMSG
jgi:alkanesulfonate monooxygenase SsuD/methylene tetrahydromethanopterin reductase-like flavin-dependent oxidoreductase (luciferase family)